MSFEGGSFISCLFHWSKWNSPAGKLPMYENLLVGPIGIRVVRISLEAFTVQVVLDSLTSLAWEKQGNGAGGCERLHTRLAILSCVSEMQPSHN